VVVCVDNAHLLASDPAATAVLAHLAATTPAALLLTASEELAYPARTEAVLDPSAVGVVHEAAGQRDAVSRAVAHDKPAAASVVIPRQWSTWKKSRSTIVAHDERATLRVFRTTRPWSSTIPGSGRRHRKSAHDSTGPTPTSGSAGTSSRSPHQRPSNDRFHWSRKVHGAAQLASDSGNARRGERTDRTAATHAR
jgi:hypothetical protein